MNTTTELAQVEEDEPLEVSIGIFIGILGGSLLLIFLIIGLCILSHIFYMRFFKKPWVKKQSKKIWYIDTNAKSDNNKTSKNKSNFIEPEEMQQDSFSLSSESICSLDKSYESKNELKQKNDFDFEKTSFDNTDNKKNNDNNSKNNNDKNNNKLIYQNREYIVTQV